MAIHQQVFHSTLKENLECSASLHLHCCIMSHLHAHQLPSWSLLLLLPISNLCPMWHSEWSLKEVIHIIFYSTWKLRTTCISFLGCNKLLQTWWLKALSSHISGGQKSNIMITGLKSLCQQGHALSGDPREETCSLPLPASGGCQHSLACGHMSPISKSVVTLPSLLCVSTLPLSPSLKG